MINSGLPALRRRRSGASSQCAGIRVRLVEGSVIMQVKGGKEALTLKPGQNLLICRADPSDVQHRVGKNASNTEPAKFVVVLIKDKKCAALTPVKEATQ